MSEQQVPQEQNAPAADDETGHRWRAIVAGGITFGAFAGFSLFLIRFAIPPDNPLMCVPETLLVVALTVPILCWQALARPKAKKIAVFGSAAIWIVGIALSFPIKPQTNLIYLPDALLLAGFLPLLFLWRFSWPWLIFGLINVAIGIFLQLIVFIPDSFFPTDLAQAKHHLVMFHPPITWWVFGGLTLGYALVRIVKNAAKLAQSSLSSRS